MENRENSIVQHGEHELLAMYHERGVQSLPALKGEPVRTKKGNHIVRTPVQFPTIERIMDYENGELTFDETLNLFQDLVDSGLAWSLQGSYGREAVELLRQGLIHARTPIARDLKRGGLA